jgi:invasion protein IalB
LILQYEWLDPTMRPTVSQPISIIRRTLAALSFAALITPISAVAQQTPESVVAAAVRDAGYECKNPAKPVPDPTASTADEKAWLIQCDKGRYRVKFMGDRGATVEPAPGP